MPLLDLQRRLRELGRIRTGVQKPVQGKKARPAKLDTFRLTSPAEHLITAAAELYGGTPRPWDGAPGEGQQWEVITESDVLDAFVPPASTLSQFYEMWSGGGCVRRCDGETELTGDRPCQCPEDPQERRDLAAKGQACKPTTRLSIILPLLPDIGVWRLESHGYYAAIELAAAQEICAMATSRGYQIPVRLRLEQREVKRPGEPTKRFAVPVMELGATLGQLYNALGVGSSEVLVDPIGRPEIATADERLRQLPPSHPSMNGRAALGAGLSVVQEGDVLRTPARKGAQRRAAPLPGGPGPIGDGAFDPDLPGPDLGPQAPVPPKAGAEDEPEPVPLGKPTPAMIRKLFAIVHEMGWSDAERKQHAGVQSFNDLSFEQASALIDQWEKLAQGSEAAPGQVREPEKAGRPSASLASASEHRSGSEDRVDTLANGEGVSGSEGASDPDNRSDGAGDTEAPTKVASTSADPTPSDSSVEPHAYVGDGETPCKSCGFAEEWPGHQRQGKLA